MSSTTTDTPYTAAQRAVNDAHLELGELLQRHEAEKAEAQTKVDEAVDALRHLKAGTEPQVRELAESVIYVTRPERWDTEEGPSALQEAIRDLLNGCPHLREKRFACKQYEGWVGQRCDIKYGFGPGHGSLTFTIGLTDEARKRLLDGGELTEAEVEAAVAYLTNLPRYVENGGGS